MSSITNEILGNLKPDPFRQTAGMDEYLSKPVRTDALLKMIMNFCHRVPEDNNRTENIDIAYALALMGNDKHILEEVSRAIVKKFPTDLMELDEAIAGNDYHTVARIAHSMKSAAKSIGAVPLRDIAYELETGGKKNDRQRITALMPDFNRITKEVIDELKKTII